jgi:hypothetical protein
MKTLKNEKRNSARFNFRYERKNFEKVMIIMLDFGVSDTLCVPIISGEIRCCFRLIPIGYDDDSMIILPDIVTCRFFSSSRNLWDVSGSGTGKFRRENCFHLPCVFPAGSVVILTGNGGKSPE